jgi:hypothetical protein
VDGILSCTLELLKKKDVSYWLPGFIALL